MVTALAVHPQSTFTAHLVESAFGIWSKVCCGAFWGGSQRVKIIACFRRGTSLLLFGKVLSAALSKVEVSNTCVTQGNVELPLPPISLDSHQTQKQ